MLAVLGAGLLIAGLWLPWYTFHLTPGDLSEITGSASGFSLGPTAAAGSALLSSVSLHLSAWDVATTIPAILLGIAAIVGVAAMLALAGRAERVGRIVRLIAFPAVLLVGYRIFHAPYGLGSVLNRTYGIYTSLIGALMMWIGGILAGSADRLFPYSASREGREQHPGYIAPPDYGSDIDPNWMRK